MTAQNARGDRLAREEAARAALKARAPLPASARVSPSEWEWTDEPLIEASPWAPDGETLAARIERTGPLSLEEAATLLDQLVDFSMHQPADGLVHSPTPRRVRLLEGTSGNDLQLLGVDGDAPSDTDNESPVFQLGVVLYTSLTAHDPFPGRTPAQAHLLRVCGRYRPATHLNRALPRAVDDFFVRTFSTDHGRRFASAFEMKAVFRHVASTAEVGPRPIARSRAVDPEIEIPVEVDVEMDDEPVVTVEEAPPSSAYRIEDALAAGFTVPGPKRTGRILFGLGVLAAGCIAATAYIARDVERPPTREETERFVETVRGEAVELGRTVSMKAGDVTAAMEKLTDEVNERVDAVRDGDDR